MVAVRQLLLVSVLLLTSATAWASPLEKLVMPGPLSAVHADIEDDCSACHAPATEETQQQLCAACHEEVVTDLVSGTGFHGKHPAVAQQECQVCHIEHEGRDAQTLNFDMDNFNHAQTDFPLLWSHSELQCQSCHLPNQAHTAVSNECSGCHADDDPHAGQLGLDCGSCHNEREWLQTTFAHEDTGFVLTGAHRPLSCDSCHAGNEFENTASECVSCHKQDDPHNGTLGSDCQQCHNTSTWTGEQFDHRGQTGFPLLGGHAGLACVSCHAEGVAASAASSECVSCHAADDAHEGRNGSDCASCHTVADWITSTFDHTKAAGFTLLGAHASLACTSCHTESLSDPLPSTCHECHNEDPHEGQLGQRCASCHNNLSWVVGVRFDHGLSAFPLLGEHSLLSCNDCHVDLRFHDVESQCSSCHADDDAHAGVFGAECESCHQPSDWQQTRFDHAEAAGFALVGAHAQLRCESCHASDALLQASSADACVECHRADDPHEMRFGADCGQCHSNAGFAPVKGF
ncbi:MAG: hypothetical protein ACR2PZ_16290 [Pseudomonadales bacterium]